jgi:Flp pilus assembly protein TadG
VHSNILKDTKGLVAVVVALLITVLLGFTAFVVDIGSVALQRQNLQKAADAAALAGAQDLPSAGNAISTAISYTDKNGVKAPDTATATTPYSGDPTKIEVVCTRTVSYTFARVFGYTQTEVSARAVAQKESLGAAFDYAIFSGNKYPDPLGFSVRLQNVLVMSGLTNVVNGSVHANYNVDANTSTIIENAEAVGTVTGTHIGTKIPGAPYIPMPDFSSVVPSIKAQAIAAGQYYTGNFSSANASSLNITQPVYVEGNANLTGISFSGVGCIYAGGKITITGSSTSYAANSSICIYSGYTSSYKADAAIDFSGSDKNFKGILFAPNGSILVTGSNYTFNGSIVGRVVDVSGSNKTFQEADASDCFPASSIILTE